MSDWACAARLTADLQPDPIIDVIRERWATPMTTDPIALAVAAERARALEAVREIVERLQTAMEENRAANGFVDSTDYCALGAARECLAAVEGKR